MFQSLTGSLNKIFDRLRSSGTLSEVQIDMAMKDIRVALIEADVALAVVDDFIAQVKVKALGQEVIRSVSPGQMVIKIIYDEIVNVLSLPPKEADLQHKTKYPQTILMIGLQGSGKTTASGKLALKFKNEGKKVLLVSLDTYRPAAQEQLQILASSIEVDSLEIIENNKQVDIINRALSKSKFYDIVIYDSAGRLHIDDQMILELSDVKELIQPVETLLVVDSMIGQSAVAIASNFDQKLNITGIVLSRIDGDAKGGAALSIKHVTNKPIKYLSSGEKLSTLEVFDPKRIASRILDMGDIVSFVEKAASAIDEAEAEKATARLQQGKFNFNDFLSQLRAIKKFGEGGIAGIIGMLPGASKIIDKVKESKLNDKKLVLQQEAIILSMTKKERKNPDILHASRKQRIAKGSGTTVQQINSLIKQYQSIKDTIKRLNKMDHKSLMRSGIDKLFS
jgi:signal recognition particle subunit SRP54